MSMNCVEMLPESAKPELEKPISDNEVASVRRNPIRDRVRPKYLDECVRRSGTQA